jgi:quercetin dioxygenase-like cupin family protein
VKKPENDQPMKKIMYLILPVMFGFAGKIAAQDKPIFPQGEISKVNNHTGTVWLDELNKADSMLDLNVAMATFAPGAKLDWHIHPAGQLLMITDGTGYYQEKGKAIVVVHKGDVVRCIPGIPHWHGASPNSSFTYIAVSTNSARNKTVWLQRVTDAEYNNVKQ